MHTKEFLSPFQLGILVFQFVLGTSIIVAPSLAYGRRDTWIAELLALAIGAFVLVLISWLSGLLLKQEGQVLFSSSLGKPLARLANLAFAWLAFILGALVLNNIESLMTTMIMENTPAWVFILSMAMVTAYTLRLGIENVARVVELYIPIGCISLVILFGLLMTEFDLAEIRPLWEGNIANILRATIVSGALPYLELLLVVYLVVILKPGKPPLKPTLLGLLAGGIVLVLRPIFITAVFGLQEGISLNFPVYSLVRQINIGTILERVDLILLALWFNAVFAKLAVCLYVVVKGLQHGFGLSDYKPLVFPVALLMVPVGVLVYENYLEVTPFLSGSWPIVLGVYFCLTLTILLVSWVRGKSSNLHKGKKGGEQVL